ncbi:hypothetical protein KC315_g14982 [Hortaea werneckii]|nr:hypothetical protein KC315_g14982 [Hortaea werneckii]
MSGSQFQGQPSQGIPNGSFPPNAPQGFRSFQGSPSAFDESQSSNDSQSMTQPFSQQQMPPHQHDPYQAPSTSPAPLQGQPSQSYNSGSMPQVPQQQMQGAGSPLPQQQWPYQGNPGQNPAPLPQQNMQPTLHQAGPPSELTSSTSEESSDSDSGSSDDNENDDVEDGDGDGVNDEEEEEQEGGEVNEDGEASRTYSSEGALLSKQHVVWSYWLDKAYCNPVGETGEGIVHSLFNCGDHTLRGYFEATSGQPRKGTIQSLIDCGDHTLWCYFEATLG